MNPEALAQTTDYVTALGLQQDPFENKLADHFFYADPGLMQRLDLLQHLTQFGDQLLLIAGPEGSGKSTLLSQFKLRAKDSWRICQLDGGKYQSAAHLLHDMADFFNTPYGDDNALIGRELVQYARSLQQDAGLAIVVIDDADQLSDDSLTRLLSLDESPQEMLRYLRMILLGDASLEARLMHLGLNNPRSPIIHRLDMQPFDTQQSAAYLMYRLAVAGYSGDSPFSSTEVEAMHKAAGGLPGKLNQYARETLSETVERKVAAKKTSKDKPARPSNPQTAVSLGKFKLPQPVIGVGALVLAAGIIWFSGIFDGDDESADLEMQPLQLPEDVESVVIDEEPVQPDLSDTPIVRLPPEKRIRDTAGYKADNRAEEPVATPDVEPPPAAATPPAEEPPAATTEPPTATADSGSNADDSAISAMQDELARELAAMDQPASPKEQEQPEPVPQAAPEPQQPAEQPAQQEPATPPPAPAPTAKASLPDWVAQAPAEHYTLQLVGLSQKASAETYLKERKLGKTAAIITGERQGAPWYTIIYGDYPSKEAAKAADLPASLTGVQPWPRTFAAVREAAKP